MASPMLPMNPPGLQQAIPHPAPRSDAGTAWSERTFLSAWLISLAVHTAVFIGMFLLVFPYSPNFEIEPPVARTELVGEIDADPTDAASQVRRSWSFSDAAASMAAAFDPTEMRYSSKRPEALPDIGALGGGGQGALGAGAGQDGGLSIMGIAGDGIGSGGGDFSKFGMGGGGLGSEFFGLGRTARGVQRIVYVVDRSGSMADTFGYVRKELRRSIAELRRSQKFHVIFFSAGDTVENPPMRLVSAIAAQKQQFFQFLEGVMPGGGTDPEPAMRRAMSLEPDLVYFLTDGEFDDSLVLKLREWNKNKRARIFTIAFFGAEGAAKLEQIAREHGGEYRFVSENDLP